MATRALSADAGRASSEIPENISAPSRRGLLGIATIGALAIAAPAIAAPVEHWDVGDWVDRWHHEGCGLKVGGNALHLKARLNGDRRAIALLIAEVAPVERQTALIRFVQSYDAVFQAIEPCASIRRLEATFAIWKNALYRLNNDGGDETYDAPLWEQLNASEDELVRSSEVTPRLSVMRLWIALQSQLTQLEAINAVSSEDLATIVRLMPDEDWNAKIIIQALRALPNGGAA